ncbi:hypothetical protein NX801_23700 [Streptomyces sp. LP05-1]|uniref:3-oxoacyl-ACP synthase n=1 Tax=Streptomyces pyxinae TaxID=2970734 RepID=A0ABT2CMF5_9ACTN|nr:3-oxoacyl-[acyl-carrier-protein] synthase III C-terminal domain-containing protein [Streptomyces sp. LP05-1]MCS0638605.1 hypothetical protein [Streptomyces sp. LP05-1]
MTPHPPAVAPALRCAAVRQVAVEVPAGRQTAEEVEEDVRRRNPGIRLMPGVLRQTYGLEERRVAPAGTLPSDLAATAARSALDQAGLGPGAVDLLIFASASEDMEEPATAHVVADKLGVTAPVFDVKNACNGLLNALEIANSFIGAGRYSRVLVTTGERSSLLSRLPVRDRDELALMMPVFTRGDLGAALLVEESGRPGLLGGSFVANSAGWRSVTAVNPYISLDLGGTARAVRFDSQALADSFAGMERHGLDALHALGHKSGDLDLVCVHQPSVPFTRTTLDALGVEQDKVVPVFPRYGDVATAALPLQLAEARRLGRLRPGDLVALFGLAGGASAGMLLLEWDPDSVPAGPPL